MKFPVEIEPPVPDDADDAWKEFFSLEGYEGEEYDAMARALRTLFANAEFRKRLEE